MGKEHVVLDLSCRRMDEDEDYYVVNETAGRNLPENGCGQNFWMSWRSTVTFLVHAAMGGKTSGIEQELVKLLGKWGKIPVTYAGGISEYDDIADIRELSDGKLNVTIGSALDLFGGPLNYETVLSYIHDV